MKQRVRCSRTGCKGLGKKQAKARPQYSAASSRDRYLLQFSARARHLRWIRNVFRRTYRVRHFALPPNDTVPPGRPFSPVPVFGPGSRYDYKQLDVTVELAVSRPGFGWIGARVSAIRFNPAQEVP